ncbi:MAG: hypothetical protein ACR2O2_17480 [Ruegeria sp.]
MQHKPKRAIPLFDHGDCPAPHARRPVVFRTLHLKIRNEIRVGIACSRKSQLSGIAPKQFLVVGEFRQESESKGEFKR